MQKYLDNLADPAGFLRDLFKNKSYILDSSEESSSENENEPETKQKNKLKVEKKFISSESENEYIDSELNETIVESGINSLNNQISRSCSITMNENTEINNKISKNFFISRLPPWGGTIFKNSFEIRLTNTCTIDYFLLSLWLSTKFSNKIIQLVNESIELKDSLLGIINSIELNHWNNAKSICVLDICKIEPLL